MSELRSSRWGWFVMRLEQCVWEATGGYCRRSMDWMKFDWFGGFQLHVEDLGNRLTFECFSIVVL